MKVALVYDRVNKWGGAERVLLDLHKIFPDAPLYTSVYNPKTAKWADNFPEVISSWLSKIPFAKTNHEILAPLMPLAFESFDFSGFDVVISVTSEFAKAIVTKPGTMHICICLTPTRYLWSGYGAYFDFDYKKVISGPVVSYLQKFDKIAAKRPDYTISISTEVAARVKRYYGIDSEIIFPALSSDLISTTPAKLRIREPYFLLVSRLVKYKNVDLAIKTFNKTGQKLVIVGTGAEEDKLKYIAAGNISFTGRVGERKLAAYYKNCRALIFPQHEDFGLVSLEAQAFGKPVIALKSGGALDTVVDGKTGIFFEKESVSNLEMALKEFEKTKFSRQYIIGHAQKFSFEVFREKLLNCINIRI